MPSLDWQKINLIFSPLRICLDLSFLHYDPPEDPMPLSQITILTHFQVTSEYAENTGPKGSTITWAKVEASLDLTKWEGNFPVVMVQFHLESSSDIAPKLLELNYRAKPSFFHY